MAAFVVMLSLLFTVLYIVWYDFMEHQVIEKYDKETVWCTWSAGMIIRNTLLPFLLFGRFALVSLFPPADDLRVTRLVILFDIVALCVGFWYLYKGMSINAMYIAYLVSDSLCAFCLALSACCKSSKPMQRWMWRAIGVWISFKLITEVISVIDASRECGHVSNLILWCPFKFWLLCVACQPRWRHRFHKYISFMIERRSEKRAAASVAGLVGSCPVEEVLSQAKARFRSIRLGDLCFDDLEDSTPNPELFSRSSPEILGECDAFVSHSWHDEPVTKWAALQQWRSAFVLEHGREPRVWIDRCCIDQSNIDCDLRCLPIYLSGCRQIIVFCGTTYLCRLWCIMEVFTFVHMGRSIDKLEFQLLLQEGRQQQQAAALKEAFERFDVRECECFRIEDKERMLKIIDSAYVDAANFSSEVSSIFRNSLSDKCFNTDPDKSLNMLFRSESVKPRPEDALACIV